MSTKFSLNTITNNYTAIIVWRVVILYLLLALLRCVFYFHNSEIIGEIGASEVGDLLLGAYTFDSVSILYANGLWLILSLLPIRARVSRWYQKSLFWLYIVVNSLLLIVANFADTIYFHYVQKRFTGDELKYTENGNNAALVVDFAAENWWMIPIAALIIALLVVAYRKDAKVCDPPASDKLYYPLHTIVLLATITWSIAAIRGGGLNHALRPLTLTNVTKFTSEEAKGYLILSNPFCVIRTLGIESITSPNYFEKDKLEKLYTPYHYPTKEQAESATQKGKNVMVFILESFSAENSALLAPDLYADGEVGYMPFLDSLMRDGVTMHKMYANNIGRSICAPPAIIGSLPSLKTPFALLPQSMGESRQMPTILGDMGYSSAFFCGSIRASMGFYAYVINLAGIDRYYSLEDYEAVHGKKNYDGAWGIFDMPFTEYVGEVLTDMPEPFFATQFNISSHHPFTIPKDYAEVLPKGETKIQPLITYTDMAIKNFFEKYQSEEWFQRTIFVFVSDHVSSEKFAERTRSYPGNHHIVGGIYTPDGSLKGDIYDVTQQADIMPTILGLVGNEEPYFAFGRDIFNEKDRPKWSVSYVGKTTAYTNDGVISVDESDELKAYEQQYLEHVIESSYIAPPKE